MVLTKGLRPMRINRTERKDSFQLYLISEHSEKFKVNPKLNVIEFQS